MNTTKSPNSQPESPGLAGVVFNDPTPLTPLESLLLSQAVWELGADNWPAVSEILSNHPLLSRPKSFFAPQPCHDMYAYLMNQANLECNDANNVIHATRNLKLAQRHYQSRVEELRQLIAAEELKFKKIATEIQEIRQGLWDEKIQAQPATTDTTPSSPVLVVPEGEAHDNPPHSYVEQPSEPSPSGIVEDAAGPREVPAAESEIGEKEEEGEEDREGEEAEMAEKPSQLEIPSAGEVFDGSDLSGVTDTASPPSQSPNDVELSIDVPPASQPPGGDVISHNIEVHEPVEPIPEELATPPAHSDAASSMDIDEEDMDVEPSEGPLEREEEATPSNRPSAEPEGTLHTFPADAIDGGQFEMTTDDKEPHQPETLLAQSTQDEVEPAADPASSEMEVEREATRDASIERVQQELQDQLQPPMTSPPPPSTAPPPTSASPAPVASESLEALQDEGPVEPVNEDEATSDEEPLQQTRRPTRHRPSITPSAPPARSRGRGRKAKGSRANTETSLIEPSPEVDVTTISPKVEEEDQIPSPAAVLAPETTAATTRKRDGKRKVSVVENIDSPRDKKRVRDESEPAEEEEAGPSTNAPRPRKRDRTEEQVALKRFQNVIGMLHSQISQHRNGNIFHNPIRNSEAPDYHEIVKRPMDLKTIKVKVKDGVIANSLEYQRDIFLMFANAMMYNRPGSDVYVMAEDMMLESEDYIKSFRQTEGLVRGAHRV